MLISGSIFILRILLPAAYLMVSAGYFRAFVEKRDTPYGFVKPVFISGLLFHALLLALLFADAGGFPFGTIPRGLFLCSFILALMLFSMENIIHETGYGVFLLPINFLVSTLALILLNTGEPFPAIMMSYHYILHVSFMFAAYACLLFSFILSVLYLIQHTGLKTRRPGTLFGRLPSLDNMDQTIRVMDTLGLSLLILGIITGLLWLDAIGWGVPRDINVKAGFIMLAAIVYLAEHFLRIGKGWKGRRACLVSMAGFVLIICTLLVGRHGY